MTDSGGTHRFVRKSAGRRALLCASIAAGSIVAATTGAMMQPASAAGRHGVGTAVGAPDTKLTPTVAALLKAAKSQIGVTTIYDPAYVRLAYPGGDVPMERGVCTDVVIRAYRAIGVDLQVLVHNDMVKNFSKYPRTALRRPDPNIDHRRVKNLSVFYRRQGAALPVTQNPADYRPGDIVNWDLSGLDHTGLVSDVLVPGTNRYKIVHNIGSGAQLEDVLFSFPITGHFRYLPANAAA